MEKLCLSVKNTHTKSKKYMAGRSSIMKLNNNMNSLMKKKGDKKKYALKTLRAKPKSSLSHIAIKNCEIGNRSKKETTKRLGAGQWYALPNKRA